jgi:predicted esterase
MLLKGKEVQNENIKKDIEIFLKGNNFYNIHQYLRKLMLPVLQTSHIKKYSKSQIVKHLEFINQLITKIDSLEMDDHDYHGRFLVLLSTIAKSLQECRIFQGDTFVLLGDHLLNLIEQRRHETSYLNCQLIENNNAGYSLINRLALFGKGGPFGGLVSAVPLDGIITPFYQNEIKLFNLVPIGAKGHLSKLNKEFTENKLSDYPIERTLQRYRLPRIGKIHKDHFINVFEAHYFNESNIAEPPLYIVGFHGNAYAGSEMLRYLDNQAMGYLRLHPNSKRLVVIAPDYPGSAASGGKFNSLDDLANDSVVLVIKHLLKCGISPSNIITIGHSLGGAVLTTGLAKLQAEGIYTTTVILNSFSQIQKFVGDSSFLANLIAPHYNNNSTKFFQQLPIERRHVEHTHDDPVIPLEISLLQSLGANAKQVTEGKILDWGGHDLDVHDLTDYIEKVSNSYLEYAQKDDNDAYNALYGKINPIIMGQKVAKIRIIVASTYEVEDEDTPLGQLKADFNLLVNWLNGNSLNNKTIILLGFVAKCISDIQQYREWQQSRSFSLFGSQNPQLDALVELKTKLNGSLITKGVLGHYFLTTEFLSHCQAEYESCKDLLIQSPSF